jgi:IS1 family transposase
MRGEHFSSDGDWIWTSVCEPSKYLLCTYAGLRSRIVAGSFVTRSLNKTACDCIPIFITDGYNPYKTALKRRYYVHTGEKDGRGRPSKDKCAPHPNLNYGQVIKTRNGKKLEKVEYKIIFGKVPKELLNTSAVERENLSVRLFNSRARRRTTAFARSKRVMNNALELYRVTRNFCNDHASLCIPRKHNNGVFMHVTPAMAMGVTDHPWNMRELMTFSYRQNINYVR